MVDSPKDAWRVGADGSTTLTPSLMVLQASSSHNESASSLFQKFAISVARSGPSRVSSNHESGDGGIAAGAEVASVVPWGSRTRLGIPAQAAMGKRPASPKPAGDKTDRV